MASGTPRFTHLQIFPVLGTERCMAGNHDGWAINTIDSNDHAIYAGTVFEDRVPAEVIADLIRAYPEMDGHIEVQWQSDYGAIEKTPVGGASAVMDYLMEIVSDETPEDAENTDDHPLEEMRSILLDIDDLIREAPSPE